jgi:hypothetical protein
LLAFWTDVELSDIVRQLVVPEVLIATVSPVSKFFIELTVAVRSAWPLPNPALNASILIVELEFDPKLQDQLFEDVQ